MDRWMDGWIGQMDGWTNRVTPICPKKCVCGGYSTGIHNTYKDKCQKLQRENSKLELL